MNTPLPSNPRVGSVPFLCRLVRKLRQPAELARSSHEAIADSSAEFVSAVRAGYGNFFKASNPPCVPQTAMKPLPVLPRIAKMVFWPRLQLQLRFRRLPASFSVESLGH